MQIRIQYAGVNDAQNAARALNRALQTRVKGVALLSDGNADMLKEVFTVDAEGCFLADCPEGCERNVETVVNEYPFKYLGPVSSAA